MRKFIFLMSFLLLFSFYCKKKPVLKPAEEVLLQVGILPDVKEAIVEGESLSLHFGEKAVANLKRIKFSASPGEEFFAVQIGSFSDRNRAEDLARRERGEVIFQKGFYKVVVGRSRERKRAFEKLLSISERFPEAFIVKIWERNLEFITAQTEKGSFSSRTFEVHPEKGLINVKGRRYRGFLKIIPSAKGLTVVNVVPLEDYIKGVVPCELSPERYPSLEALKALAVAARTYALKHRGKYSKFGYDLCADQNCQAYCGADAESSLSNRAVEETKGEVLFYRGEIAEALYSMSCGGSTEKASLIFPGSDYPYLQPVECSGENLPWWLLSSEKECQTTDDLSILCCLDIVKEDEKELEIKAGLVEKWLWRTIRFKKGKVFPRIAPGLSLKQSFYSAVKKAFPSLGSSLLPPKKFDTKNELSKDEIAAVLIQILFRAGETFREGTLEDIEKDRIKIDEREFLLDPRICLFRKDRENRFYPAHQLFLLRGQKLSFLELDGRIKALFVHLGFFPEENFHWSIRLLKSDLQKRISVIYPIGTLLDLVPLRRGPSGRVVELKVLGSKADFLLKGARIKKVLGLRDTWFIIDREYDEDGEIEAFVFSGKGWGHGVGLCQRGAFLMALEGADYREILMHYYPGTVIIKWKKGYGRDKENKRGKKPRRSH